MRETGSIHVKIKGGSVADTAKRTGMSESAVKIGIDRGLKARGANVPTESDLY
jgi:RNA polymerase sigma-70 factor (ECF subfamily)